MKINQLSKLTNVLSKTIRYYEDVGLLPKASRNSNGYREYRSSDVDNLIFIRRCRELQIPLEKIKILIQVQTDTSSSCSEVDLLIKQQLENVRETINELSLLEKTLHTLAKSCSNDIVGECEILKNLKQ
ncbi:MULTISPECIES: Cd(II)/Pb(II)-responsive transcriptional regulator [Colwellia]|jgi:DNA-binding transcriptional MerR regulator|uniref:Transcriptional regulator, MerR family n=1 Tax=Colwellia psychrerythraea (strain 34H / ATCC BAA-681) TaxID=167879 RepID=Q483T1_COLP3|nr:MULTISPECIES: Cd(II)/Pb(II)-responsive transcriptional regulator [Colwellia]AAZ25870.1 transcriptional regulator, MerR family [Colwellia psychrerythraea 34H]PKH88058.1 Cd(II)/Pb(II)-responsive transcriptional regulator [Colwellia sp. Bg11-28]